MNFFPGQDKLDPLFIYKFEVCGLNTFCDRRVLVKADRNEKKSSKTKRLRWMKTFVLAWIVLLFVKTLQRDKFVLKKLILIESLYPRVKIKKHKSKVKML